MRNVEKLTENMPADLKSFYLENIGMIKEEIGRFFPRRMDDEFFERVTGLAPLFEQDMDVITEAVLEPVHDYLQYGGKVLRPVLSAIILDAYGCDPADYGLFLGSIEVMEDSTIMMDDFIDNSLKRRGGDCSHISHGFAIANISSNTSYGMSHYLFYNNEFGFSSGKAAEILNAFAWEHIQMGFGQMEELYWTEKNVNTVSVGEYLQETIARCAFLSFRGPLKYAGMIAGAPAEDIKVLDTVGEHLLIGYHIKGDNLDMTPDSDAWGKIAGEDITTGRRTLLINYVLSKASDDEKKIIESILDSRTRDEELKRKVYEYVIKYDGLGYASELAQKYHKKTGVEIDKLQISDYHKMLLHQFSGFAAVKRTL